MAHTFAEKALARAAGLREVSAGQIVDACPDLVLSHDNSAAIAKIFYSLGVQKAAIPERMVIVLDHAVPAPTPQHAQNHAEIRTFVAEQGLAHFFEVGRGICHQVVSEAALILPGQLLLGADSHSTHAGWLGAFGAGIGRTEAAVLWATGELWLRVPETLQIVVSGELRRGLTSKDLCLHIIGQLGADGGIYTSVEVSGPAIDKMSLESRMVIPNMLAEFGVKNAYLPPDEAVFDWLAARILRREGQERPAGERRDRDAVRQSLREAALYPDPGAAYAAVHTFDASALELTVACPHSVDHTQPLSAVRGVRIQQAFLGTCTNGRLEDLAAAAGVIQGKRVAPGTRFIVIPASSEIYAEALRLGLIQTFVAAGAVIGVPGCGPCMGNHLGVLAPGETCISSANRNFKGRMGQPEAEVYLANPAVVAASAVLGRIADPSEVL